MTLALNQVHQGDCLELMAEIDNCSIDMVLTSPPYDNLRTYNGSLEWGEHIWKPVISELFRVIKTGGIVVWVVADATINGSETGTSFKQALWAINGGFNLHDTMIYESEKPPLTHNRYEQKFEYMFVWSKGKPETFNPILIPAICKRKIIKAQNRGPKRKKEINSAMRYEESCNRTVAENVIKGNIWRYKTGWNGSKNNIMFKHPAIFPEKLANDHIKSWSNEGDIILDPFAGSGTTGVACKRWNRNFILIEKEPEYCEIARRRLDAENNLFSEAVA